MSPNNLITEMLSAARIPPSQTVQARRAEIIAKGKEHLLPKTCRSCGRTGLTMWPVNKLTPQGVNAVCGDCVGLVQHFGSPSGPGVGRLTEKTRSMAVIEPDRMRLITTVTRESIHPGPGSSLEIIHPNDLGRMEIVNELLAQRNPHYVFIIFQSSSISVSDLVLNIDPGLIEFSGPKGLDGIHKVNADIVRNYYGLLQGHVSDVDFRRYLAAKESGDKTDKTVVRIEGLFPFLDDFSHPSPNSDEARLVARMLKPQKETADV